MELVGNPAEEGEDGKNDDAVVPAAVPAKRPHLLLRGQVQTIAINHNEGSHRNPEQRRGTKGMSVQRQQE